MKRNLWKNTVLTLEMLAIAGATGLVVDTAINDPEVFSRFGIEMAPKKLYAAPAPKPIPTSEPSIYLLNTDVSESYKQIK